MQREFVMPGARFTMTPFAAGAVPLASDEVRIWLVSLDEPPLDPAVLRESLCPEERIRADRYRLPKVRHQFVTGRGLLRHLLGWQLGISPRAVEISYAGAGKPILADRSLGLHFNLTHADGLALIALSRSPVGIDMERIRTLPDPEGLVRRFFSPAECSAYLALPTELRPLGFFRAWTCKEAVIKTVGLSVTCLDDFDVELHPQRPAALLAARHPAMCRCRWELTAWEPRPGFTAAAAVRSESS